MTYYEIMEHLIEEAKKYDADELWRFQCEIGWEDWMKDYTEVAEGEPITERESEEINKILREAFDKAHNED